jgi:hypothetical protein
MLSHAAADGERLTVTAVAAPPWQSAAAAARPTLVAAAAPAAPQLNGTLNDPCWAGKPGVAVFAQPKGLPQAARRWVSVRASYDAEHLYLAARLAKPGATLRATVTENGGRIWQDDALEIFLADRERGVPYQIDVNARGAWWAGSKGSWKPEVTTGATIDEDGWTVELALPWRDLGFAAPGERALGIQFRYLVHEQSASVSWTGADRGQIDAYGDLTLAAAVEGDALPANRLRVQRFFQRPELPAGSSPAGAGVEVDNPGDAARSIVVQLTHVPLGNGRWKKPASSMAMADSRTVDVPPGERRIVLMKGVMPAIPSGVIRQTLRVYAVNPVTGKPGERLLQHTRDVATTPPFRLRLQRERFYHGDRALRGTIDIGIAEEAFTDARLQVEFGTRSTPSRPSGTST